MADSRVFPADVLDRWRTEREVLIETASDGEPRRTIIWIVVDGAGRALIRSYRGARAKWYREALATGRGAIVIGDDRVPVRFEVATDPERIAACSTELEAKYAGDSSTPAMVRDEVLDTTLEVRPDSV
jgi:hypothetical protein